MAPLMDRSKQMILRKKLILPDLTLYVIISYCSLSAHNRLLNATLLRYVCGRARVLHTLRRKPSWLQVTFLSVSQWLPPEARTVNTCVTSSVRLPRLADDQRAQRPYARTVVVRLVNWEPRFSLQCQPQGDATSLPPHAPMLAPSAFHLPVVSSTWHLSVVVLAAFRCACLLVRLLFRRLAPFRCGHCAYRVVRRCVGRRSAASPRASFGHRSRCNSTANGGLRRSRGCDDDNDDGDGSGGGETDYPA